MRRVLALAYHEQPAVLPDTPGCRLLGEVVGLNGQPVRYYAVRRPKRQSRRRHDGRLRKRREMRGC